MKLQSTRLGSIAIPDLEAELAVLDAQKPNSEYDAFTYGTWESHVLANGSGASGDLAFAPHGEELRETALGAELPLIMSMVRRHFHTDNLQWVRVFGMQDGVLAPHVDFLEFDRPGVRLQIPLRTNLDCLHSENETVYHLRRGEVWQLQAAQPHSACAGAGQTRLSLCLDFDGDDLSAADVIKDVSAASGDIHIVDRPALSETELGSMIEEASTMTEGTIRSVFESLVAVHYRRNVSNVEVYSWFSEAAEKSGDARLKAKADAYRMYCVEKRAYGEHFAW